MEILNRLPDYTEFNFNELEEIGPLAIKPKEIRLTEIVEVVQIPKDHKAPKENKATVKMLRHEREVG